MNKNSIATACLASIGRAYTDYTNWTDGLESTESKETLRPAESLAQVYIAKSLGDAGLTVTIEERMPTLPETTNGQGSRADIVVWRDQEKWCVIEVKRGAGKGVFLDFRRVSHLVSALPSVEFGFCVSALRIEDETTTKNKVEALFHGTTKPNIRYGKTVMTNDKNVVPFLIEVP